MILDACRILQASIKLYTTVTIAIPFAHDTTNTAESWAGPQQQASESVPISKQKSNTRK